MPNIKLNTNISIYPSFSKDRNKLPEKNSDNKHIVIGFSNGRREAEKWAVVQCSVFQRRLGNTLSSDEEWLSLFQSSDAILSPDDTLAAGDAMVIDLEVVLKKCYSIAFSMPPSPSFQIRKNSFDQAGELPSLQI